ETVAAIDGSVGLGDKGNASRRAAGGAGRLKHLARFAIGRTGFARLAARLAARGLILEALFRVEFLFAGGEHKFRAAVPADQRFVLVHGNNSSRIFKVGFGDRLTWPLTPHPPSGGITRGAFPSRRPSRFSGRTYL